jgi:hypothetical protein
MSQGSIKNGVYTGDGSEAVIGEYGVIVDAAGPGPPSYSQHVAINDNGQIAYILADSVGWNRISRRTGNNTVTVATIGDTPSDLSGSITGFAASVDMNSLGEVAFVAVLDTPAIGVFIGDGTSIRTKFSTTNPAIGLATQISINDSADVLYTVIEAGVNSIRVTRSDATETLVSSGDSFSRRTIQSAGFAPPALNDFGQVALQLIMDDGSEVIVRADPLIPTDVPALGLMGLAFCFVFTLITGSLATSHRR